MSSARSGARCADPAHQRRREREPRHRDRLDRPPPEPRFRRADPGHPRRAHPAAAARGRGGAVPHRPGGDEQRRPARGGHPDRGAVHRRPAPGRDHGRRRRPRHPRPAATTRTAWRSWRSARGWSRRRSPWSSDEPHGTRISVRSATCRPRSRRRPAHRPGRQRRSPVATPRRPAGACPAAMSSPTSKAGDHDRRHARDDIRVLVVDDHELIRQGLVGAFDREPGHDGRRRGRHRDRGAQGLRGAAARTWSSPTSSCPTAPDSTSSARSAREQPAGRPGRGDDALRRRPDLRGHGGRRLRPSSARTPPAPRSSRPPGTPSSRRARSCAPAWSAR